MASDFKPKSSMLSGGRFTGGLDPLMVRHKEDIHTAKERRLGEIIGNNIAVIWLRDELRKTDDHLVGFLKLVAARAESEIDDLERLHETVKRINRSPLGYGDLAGNPFGIDRDVMAKELGFEGLLRNSMGGVADRDFVTEFLQWRRMLMQHVSLWVEDLTSLPPINAYSTGSSLMPRRRIPTEEEEHRQKKNTDRRRTPTEEEHRQKKNTDSLELLRGKSG
ncbi:hypothetical protein ACHAP5_007987 [Fusarium lateritium]